jgi:hypothetical protein
LNLCVADPTEAPLELFQLSIDAPYCSRRRSSYLPASLPYRFGLRRPLHQTRSCMLWVLSCRLIQRLINGLMLVVRNPCPGSLPIARIDLAVYTAACFDVRGYRLGRTYLVLPAHGKCCPAWAPYRQLHRCAVHRRKSDGICILECSRQSPLTLI